MCNNCVSRNQGAYNEQHPTKAGAFVNNNTAITQSGSVSEKGLTNPQNVKYEQQYSPYRGNPTIGERGWGG